MHKIHVIMLYSMPQTHYMSPQILYLATQTHYLNPQMPYLTAQAHYLNLQMPYLTGKIMIRILYIEGYLHIFTFYSGALHCNVYSQLTELYDQQPRPYLEFHPLITS